MERDPPVIAIDGPSASGKGTVAQAVARELGFHYLNSGALYRALALAGVQPGSSLDDHPALAAAALRLRIEFAGEAVLVDGRDVTVEIQAGHGVGRFPRRSAQGLPDGEPRRKGGQTP